MKLSAQEQRQVEQANLAEERPYYSAYELELADMDSFVCEYHGRFRRWETDNGGDAA